MRYLFFLISTVILGLFYFYIGYRLIKPSSLGRRNKRIFWTLLMIVPVFLPLSFLLRFVITNKFVTDLFTWMAYILMGFFSILLFFLLAKDGFLAIQKAISKIQTRVSAASSGGNRFDPERRKFLIKTANLSILGISGMLTGFGIYEARRNPHLEQITVPINNLPEEFEGFRIVQFSDVHVGPTIKRKFVESVVDQINHLAPDLIACTGDMVDGSVQDLRDDVAPLRDLQASFGKFFVTGNHEYYVDTPPWLEEIDRLGFTLLMNEHRMIQKDKGQLVLAGVTDITAGRFISEHQSDPQKAVEGVPQNLTKILMAHQPRSIYSATTAGYDLQISGHTHGGQYLPWSYLVTLAQPYVAGLHRHENSWVYVNRGTGYWGPPLRIGVPSEVTLIILSRDRAA